MAQRDVEAQLAAARAQLAASSAQIVISLGKFSDQMRALGVVSAHLGGDYDEAARRLSALTDVQRAMLNDFVAWYVDRPTHG